MGFCSRTSDPGSMGQKGFYGVGLPIVGARCQALQPVHRDATTNKGKEEIERERKKDRHFWWKESQEKWSENTHISSR